MGKKNLMEAVEGAQLKTEGREAFDIGDTVNVHLRIKEGQKSRIQVFKGTVIARKGSGSRASFTVRRLVGTEGVERVFPLHSPAITKIEVKRKGRVRRAKLYYLRERIGKATKVSEKLTAQIMAMQDQPQEAGTPPQPEGAQIPAPVTENPPPNPVTP